MQGHLLSRAIISVGATQAQAVTASTSRSAVKKSVCVPTVALRGIEGVIALLEARYAGKMIGATVIA
jgi:hypothetical protein